MNTKVFVWDVSPERYHVRRAFSTGVNKREALEKLVSALKSGEVDYDQSGPGPGCLVRGSPAHQAALIEGLKTVEPKVYDLDKFFLLVEYAE